MGEPKPLTIGLADDHPIMRAALASALADLGDASFLEASDANETLALIEAHPDLDLLLVDLRMPGADGIDVIRTIRARAPQVPVVVVSADEWKRKTMRKGTLAQFLLASPLRGSDLDVEREHDEPRDLPL